MITAERNEMAGTKKPDASDMKALQEDIRLKKFRRVYLLYGEEEYLVQQYRRELIRAVCGDGDSMNLNIHREDHLDWNTVQDEILSLPFFAEYRMVVLDDTKLFRPGRKTGGGAGDFAEENGAEPEPDSGGGSEADLSAAVAQFLPGIPDSTVVLFTEHADEKKPGGQKGKTAVDKRSRLFKAVGKCGLAVSFSTPDEPVLRKWVLAKLGAEKIRITNETLDTFLSMTGTDMSHISTETQKLISCAGYGGIIRTEDVKELTSEILESRIFRMLDLLSLGDRRGALDLYDDLLQVKEPPVKILILIMRQFDQLMLVRSILDDGGSIGRVMEELGTGRWQADKAMRQAAGFSLASLRRMVEECVRMQERAQSGQIDMRLGLELLIMKSAPG